MVWNLLHLSVRFVVKIASVMFLKCCELLLYLVSARYWNVNELSSDRSEVSLLSLWGGPGLTMVGITRDSVSAGPTLLSFLSPSWGLTCDYAPSFLFIEPTLSFQTTWLAYSQG